TSIVYASNNLSLATMYPEAVTVDSKSSYSDFDPSQSSQSSQQNSCQGYDRRVSFSDVQETAFYNVYEPPHVVNLLHTLKMKKPKYKMKRRSSGSKVW
ncbi:hypothetical protein SARC_10262, partial [Sphaeroforma arctica JP610]